MLTMKAKDAQARFGEIMSKIAKEPVAVNRYGRPTAVIISHDEYEKYQKLEDLYWSHLAKEASDQGYLSAEESNDILNNILLK